MKTLSIYKLKQENLQEVLNGLTEEVLEEYKFKKCGDYDAVRLGFSLNYEDTYLSQQREGTLIKLTEQIKRPEPNAIKEKLETRIALHKADTGADAPKKQKDMWKSEITDSLLPETYAKEPKTFKFFLRKDGVIFVEANYKKAEDFIALIRKALGSFQVVPLETDLPVGDLLDSLVKETSDDYFELLEKATLVTGEDRTVSLSKASLYNSEAQDLVKDGAYVTSLQLMYDGMVSFVLKDDMTLSALKYDEQLQGDGEEEDHEATGEFLQLVEVSKIVDEIIKRLSENK